MKGGSDFAQMLFVHGEHFCASAAVVGFEINVSFRAGFRTQISLMKRLYYIELKKAQKHYFQFFAGLEKSQKTLIQFLQAY